MAESEPIRELAGNGCSRLLGCSFTSQRCSQTHDDNGQNGAEGCPDERELTLLEPNRVRYSAPVSADHIFANEQASAGEHSTDGQHKDAMPGRDTFEGGQKIPVLVPKGVLHRPTNPH
jgi:hypothetical protein